MPRKVKPDPKAKVKAKPVKGSAKGKADPVKPNAPTHGNRGVPKSAEHRAKIAAALKGRVLTPEHRDKISKALKGKRKSKEAARKSADARRGRKRSPAEIAKTMAGLRARQEMVEAGLIPRRQVSPEHRVRIGIGQRKRWANADPEKLSKWIAQLQEQADLLRLSAIVRKLNKDLK